MAPAHHGLGNGDADNPVTNYFLLTFVVATDWSGCDDFVFRGRNRVQDEDRCVLSTTLLSDCSHSRLPTDDGFEYERAWCCGHGRCWRRIWIGAMENRTLLRAASVQEFLKINAYICPASKFTGFGDFTFRACRSSSVFFRSEAWFMVFFTSRLEPSNTGNFSQDWNYDET